MFLHARYSAQADFCTKMQITTRSRFRCTVVVVDQDQWVNVERRRQPKLNFWSTLSLSRFTMWECVCLVRIRQRNRELTGLRSGKRKENPISNSAIESRSISFAKIEAKSKKSELSSNEPQRISFASSFRSSKFTRKLVCLSMLIRFLLMILVSLGLDLSRSNFTLDANEITRRRRRRRFVVVFSELASQIESKNTRSRKRWEVERSICFRF